MSGRGAYYKAKYGGGRGGRGGRDEVSREHVFHGASRSSADATALMEILRRIDGKQYGAYKDLYDTVYHVSTPVTHSLEVVHVQSDPFAPPSRIVVRVPLGVTAFPPELHSNSIRTIALCDFLQRSFVSTIRSMHADVKEGGSGWGGAKGGNIKMDEPGQHVLQRSGVQINANERCLEIRFQLGLPASGRSIEGRWCAQLMFETVPLLISKSLLYSALDGPTVLAHVLSVEDQSALRSMLETQGLVAFVKNGAILPRRSGASDLPLGSSSAMRQFSSPPSMQTSFVLPNSGRIDGMGIRKGVTLICGGGFHGKSTLLGALEVGIYNHIPGDGREFVCVDESAVKIRAEDGRSVTDLNISPFINNLPLGQPTNSFNTACASGSTSQSANILEMLEMGSRALLLDEDTCATNFMFRDAMMTQLVAGDKEPITPFLARVRELWVSWGVSTIMVVGGCGAFFAVADSVIVMDTFEARDVSHQARAICDHESFAGGLPSLGTGTDVHFVKTFSSAERRCFVPASLEPPKGEQLRAKDIGKIQIGKDPQDADGNANFLDLTGLEQIVELGQTRAISEAFQTLSRLGAALSMVDALSELLARATQNGLDELVNGRSRSLGDLSSMRKFELAGAINRWRHLKIIK